MELIEYWGVLRRWSMLIIAGTLVAALVGYRVALRTRGAVPPRYAGTASVVVNYVTPPGVGYIPTLSVHTQVALLSSRVTDPAVLRLVAAQAHVTLSQVQQVSATVDAQQPLITVHVLGSSPPAASAVAQGLAGYLAGVQTQQVQALADSLSRTAARAMAQAQQRWLAAQAHYYDVCGCIAGRPALADPATLSRLRAELDLLQANYLSAAGRYMTVHTNPVSVATALPGTVHPVTTRSPSATAAVLPAAALGFLLSIALGALLDYRRTGAPVSGTPRGPLRAPWPGQMRDAETQMNTRSAALSPGSFRPLRVVLPAAAVGLLLSIAVAALLAYRLPPTAYRLPRADPDAGVQGRRRLQGAAQRAGPPASLRTPYALVLNPEAVSLSHHDGHTPGPARTIYVVNVGPAPVTVTTITITGPDRRDFVEVDTCTRGAMGVYGGCTIIVRFAPTTRGTGPHHATLVIADNASSSPLRLSLSA